MPRKAKIKDWTSVMDCFTGDTTQVPFHQKNPANKRKHRTAFYDGVSELFDSHGIRNADDCLDMLNYCKSKLGQKSSAVQAKLVLDNQMARLTLPERNTLTTLLTHADGELNRDMITLFPFLEQRSEKLLDDAIMNRKRKERDDKIDLTLISEFMHDYCR